MNGNSEIQKELIVIQDPASKAAEELVATLAAQGNVEVVHSSDPNEVKNLIHSYGGAMLIACIANNESAKHTIALLKRLKAEIEAGQVKSLILSKIKNKPLEQKITKLGATDYIDEPVQARALLFKGKLQIKTLESIRKRRAESKTSSNKIFKQTEHGSDNEVKKIQRGDNKSQTFSTSHSEQNAEEIRHPLESTLEEEHAIAAEIQLLETELEKQAGEDGELENLEKQIQKLVHEISSQKKGRKKLELKLSKLKSKLLDPNTNLEEDDSEATPSEWSNFNGKITERKIAEIRKYFETRKAEIAKKINAGISKILKRREKPTQKDERIVHYTAMQGKNTLNTSLAINVIITDALFGEKPIHEIAEKFSHLLSKNIPDSRITILSFQSQNKGKVLGCSDDTLKAGEVLKVDPAILLRDRTRLLLEIKKNHASEVLGFLYLESLNGRGEFSDFEELVMRDLMTSIARYWELAPAAAKAA